MAEELSERRKLEDLDKQLTKLLGSSYYGITQKRQVENVKFIDSGCYSLNKVIGNGIPEGRLIEIFGNESTAKSLLALSVVASFQKQGKACAWLDVESCYSPEFAAACGVDNTQLAIIKDCEYAEYYLEALRLIVKSGSINLVVLDSVASLVPKEITEKAVDESTMAVVARYTSKLLPELCALMSRNKVTVIFINQLRSTLKSYGQCFHEDTPVLFADGTTHFIKEVYENKLEGPVVSYNTLTNTFENKPILNWFKNGTLDINAGETWLSFTLNSQAHKHGGVTSFTCTPNHSILLPDNTYTKAENLKQGDKLVSFYEEHLSSNNIYQDIVYASLLGDGTIKDHSKNSCYFSLSNSEQEEYLNWKLDKLKELKFRKFTAKSLHIADTEFSREFCKIKDIFYLDGKRYVPEGLKLTPLMAAVWYMDDGSTDNRDYHCRGIISIGRWKDSPQLETYRKLLADFLAVDTKVITVKEGKNLALNADNFRLFCDKIKTFIPECMQYKLPEAYRGFYQDFDSGTLIKTLKPHLLEITDISTSKRKLRSKWKYDIQIEDNSNYIVGGYYGAVVHNSEETPGGKAIKYYSSVRLRTSRKDVLKKNGEEVGVVIGVKAVKNKCGNPFGERQISAYFPHMEGDTIIAGIDLVGDVVDAAFEEGVITGSKAWMEYPAGNKINGREKMISYLKENQTILNQVKQDLLNNDSNTSTTESEESLQQEDSESEE